MTNQPLLKPDEAAEYLSVSVKQLRALTVAGRIRYVNIGLGEKRETRRYDIEDLAEFRKAQSCLFIKEKAGKPTPTTSGGEVFDIQAIRERLRSGKQNGSSSASKSRSPSRLANQPSAT